MITKTNSYSLYNTQYSTQQRRKTESNIVSFKADPNSAKIKALEETVASLRKEIADKNQEISLLKCSIKNLEETLSVKCAVIQELEKQLNEANKSIDNILNSLSATTTNITKSLKWWKRL